MTRLVPGHARPIVASAVIVWVGCLGGLHLAAWRYAALLVLPLLLLSLGALRRRPKAALGLALVAAGVVSGSAAAMRAAETLTAALPDVRTVSFSGVAVRDPLSTPFGTQLLVEVGPAVPGGLPPGLRVAVEPEHAPDVGARARVAVEGRLIDRPGWLRGVPYRAVVTDAEVVLIAPASGPVFAVGNALRSLVLDRSGAIGGSAAMALIEGFLVGETSRLPPADLEDLRRAGLSHFVAVSGSNVAMFLAAWWLVVGPVGLGPRLRSVSGLGMLVIFVVVTRWEPSVVRAATMAGLVLGGRTIGIAFDAWRALGAAVILLLLVSGQLATDIGFQLSAAATLGVLAGAHAAGGRSRGWGRAVLVATIGAQAAVLPLLLVHFGTVPLLSPIANLLAAPLVTAATALGAAGLVIGVAPIVETALLAAEGVLAIAGTAAGWPQLDLGGVVVVLGAVASARFRPLRPILAVGVVTAAVAFTLGPPAPDASRVTFLDVGQGDAILVQDVSGAAALIDGGRDVTTLRDALRRHAVDGVEILVATHGDADHVGGLESIFQQISVGQLWYPAGQELGGSLGELVAAAAALGIPTRPAAGGDRATLGTIDLEVLGPLRRYATDNDGSIVLWLTSGETSVLLTGDVEAIAQRELPSARPDVLQVPHHGSATTDLDWLARTVGSVAVISVGDNTYGHPSPAVLSALEASQASVWTTRIDGDVIIDLCGPCGRHQP